MEVASILSDNSSSFDQPSQDVVDVLRKYTNIAGWAIFMAITVIGNLFVMLAYGMDKKIRETVSNLIILHLSIADFLVAICALVYPLAVRINNGNNLNLGEIGCKIYLIADHVAVVLSMALVLCISFDRYWIVKMNIKYKSFQTRGRVKKMLAASWIIILSIYCFMVLGWESLPGYQVDSYEYCEPVFYQSLWATIALTGLTGYIPMLTIATLNILIFIYLWQHSKLFQKTKLPVIVPSGVSSFFQEDAGSTDLPTSQQRKRVVYTISDRVNKQQRPHEKIRILELQFRRNLRAAIKLAVLVVAFAVCWIPFEIAGLYSNLCDNCVSPMTFGILACLQWSNSSLNPFLYAPTNKRFRDNFKRFVKLRCC